MLLVAMCIFSPKEDMKATSSDLPTPQHGHLQEKREAASRDAASLAYFTMIEFVLTVYQSSSSSTPL